MAFPRRLLADDEQIVLDLHPHWKQLLLPSLLLPVGVGVSTYLLFVVPSGSVRAPLRWAIVAVAALVLVRFTVWPWISWQTTHYVLTTRRVVIRRGVLGRSGRDIPLTRVNDVSSSQRLWQRLLSCGQLTVESAGERGQSILQNIPKVVRVQKVVYELVEADHERRTLDDHDLRQALRDVAGGGHHDEAPTQPNP